MNSVSHINISIELSHPNAVLCHCYCIVHFLGCVKGHYAKVFFLCRSPAPTKIHHTFIYTERRDCTLYKSGYKPKRMKTNNPRVPPCHRTFTFQYPWGTFGVVFPCEKPRRIGPFTPSYFATLAVANFQYHPRLNSHSKERSSENYTFGFSYILIHIQILIYIHVFISY